MSGCSAVNVPSPVTRRKRTSVSSLPAVSFLAEIYSVKDIERLCHNSDRCISPTLRVFPYCYLLNFVHFS